MTLPRLLSTSALAIALLASPVMAHAQTGPDTTLADRAAANETELSLGAEGRAETSPDLLTATLFAQATSANLASAQGTLNAMVTRATQTAQSHSGITLTRADYNASQNGEKPARWVAQQTLRIKAANTGDGRVVLDTVAALQAQGLGVSSLDWSVSPEHHDALLATARLNALHALQAQARTAAQALGLHVVRFKSVSLATMGGIRPQVMMAARFASPQSTPETQDVQVMANGTAILAP